MSLGASASNFVEKKDDDQEDEGVDELQDELRVREAKCAATLPAVLTPNSDPTRAARKPCAERYERTGVQSNDSGYEGEVSKSVAARLEACRANKKNKEEEPKKAESPSAVDPVRTGAYLTPIVSEKSSLPMHFLAKFDSSKLNFECKKDPGVHIEVK